MNINHNNKSDFHIYLSSSDKSCKTFSKKKPKENPKENPKEDPEENFNPNSNNFTTLLVHPIYNMRKNMKVALLSYTYTNLYYNYEEGIDSIVIFDFLHYYPPYVPPNLTHLKKYGKSHKLDIKSGFYETPEEFLTAVEIAVEKCNIPRLKGKKLFTFDKHTRKFSVNYLENNYLAVLFRGYTVVIFGVNISTENAKKNYVVLGKSKLKRYYYYPNEKVGVKRYFFSNVRRWKTDSPNGGEANYSPVMSSMDRISVHSNIVLPIINGSEYTQILRYFELDHKKPKGKRITVEFSFPIYVELKSESITTIQILTKDSYGLPVHFLQGDVSIHLHFIEN